MRPTGPLGAVDPLHGGSVAPLAEPPPHGRRPIGEIGPATDGSVMNGQNAIGPLMARRVTGIAALIASPQGGVGPPQTLPRSASGAPAG
eukprot:610862-Alexandrium_andersonii.AAC.1